MSEGSRYQGREGADYSNPAGSMARSFPIRLSDTADLPCPTRVIYLGSCGVLHYLTVGGDERTRTLAAGYHPLRLQRVFVTGTTIPASDLEGHY